MDELEVLEMLRLQDFVEDSVFLKDGITPRQLEGILEKVPYVLSAKVYENVRREVFVRLDLREPLLRVFNLDGSSFYMDRNGVLMPITPNHALDVMYATGELREKLSYQSVDTVINNSTLKTISHLPELYALSKYVCLNEELSPIVEQLYLNSDMEYELIGKFGSQTILLGDTVDLENKLDRLLVFYKEGIPFVGMQKYDTINLKYKDQIVCTKKQ